MGVHVDSPNTLSVDDYLPSPLRRLSQRRAQTASNKRESCASSMAEHFSSVCRHLRSPSGLPNQAVGSGNAEAFRHSFRILLI
jgi:hypothetical protein